jgi:hypothetical protein
MKLTEINGRYIYRGAVVAVYTRVREETLRGGYMPYDRTLTDIIVVMDGGALIVVESIEHQPLSAGQTKPTENVDAAVLDVIQRLGLTVG